MTIDVAQINAAILSIPGRELADIVVALGGDGSNLPPPGYAAAFRAASGLDISDAGMRYLASSAFRRAIH